MNITYQNKHTGYMNERNEREVKRETANGANIKTLRLTAQISTNGNHAHIYIYD